MPIRAKYIGPDHFHGIPARDLTEEEYQELTPEQRADLRASSIYEVLTDREYADLVREAKRGERAPRAPSTEEAPVTPKGADEPSPSNEPKHDGGSAT